MNVCSPHMAYKPYVAWKGAVFCENGNRVGSNEAKQLERFLEVPLNRSTCCPGVEGFSVETNRSIRSVGTTPEDFVMVFHRAE